MSSTAASISATGRPPPRGDCRAVSLSMIFSENWFPPSDQVQGHAFPDHALRPAAADKTQQQPGHQCGARDQRADIELTAWPQHRRERQRREQQIDGKDAPHDLNDGEAMIRRALIEMRAMRLP